jgi:addiction module HigA family antidote
MEVRFSKSEAIFFSASNSVSEIFARSFFLKPKIKNHRFPLLMINGGSALYGKTRMPLMWKLLTTIKEIKMKTKSLPPVHPGEILLEDLMKPLGITANGLSRDLRVPATRISEIVKGKRAITADTALRLGRYFGNTPQFWMNLQTSYELELTERQYKTEIERSIHPRKAA